MVRLLLVGIFFLNLGAYAHNQAGDGDGCEVQLAHYETLRYRMYGFLKKLTSEIDQRYPEDRFFRVGLGRASGPLVAGLRDDGKQAATLPLRINLPGILRFGSNQEKRFNEVAKFYLPAPEQLAGKALLLMIYEEDPRAFVSFVAQLEMFLHDYKYPIGMKDVHVHFITRQDHLAFVRRRLELSFDREGSRFHVRPLASANEVRHWLHDSLNDLPSAHEFPMNDALGDKPLSLTREPRAMFVDLLADLRQLPARMRQKAK